MSSRRWRPGLGWLLALGVTAARAAFDIAPLWDYSQPALSEQRFRAALEQAGGDDALILRTQIARTYSLRGEFDAAHRELDALEPLLAGAGAEPRVRAGLERGRTLRSSGKPLDARPLFVRAFELADSNGLEALAADALHMVALVEPALDGQVEWNRRTAEYARHARDPKARGWEAPALNNLGVALNEAGRHPQALLAFREALAAFQRGGDAQSIRIAHWMIANTLRLLRRHDEALTMQLDLERQFDAAGAPDPEVYDELSLLYAAKGDSVRAAYYRVLQQRVSKP